MMKTQPRQWYTSRGKVNDVGVVPLSAKLKKSPTQTPSKGHGLIASTTALILLRKNRTAVPTGLPDGKQGSPHQVTD